MPRSEGLDDELFASSIITNILTFLLILFLVVLLIILILFCKRVITPRCPSFFRDIVTVIERKLFWNSVLRACLETYFMTCVAFSVSLGRIQTYDSEGKAELFVWLLTGSFCIGFPFLIFRLLFNRQEKLFERRYR